MATGDLKDFIARLKADLPNGWFPPESQASGVTAPVLNAILAGPAWSLSWIWTMIQYAMTQTRIATATDVWLDLIAQDYFGLTLTRYVNESDSAFSLRIRRNLFTPKNTRAAISQALQLLTGNIPQIFEPGNTGDTGGYGTADQRVWTGLAYNFAGGYGSLALPFQAFITIKRPEGKGVPNVAGYYYGSGWAGGGYGVGAIEYVDGAIIGTLVPDAEIYRTIAATAPVGTIMWTRITP